MPLTLAAVAAAMLAFTTAPAANAATIWQGPANGDWSNAGNWSAGEPGSSVVATFDGSGASPATVDVDSDVGGLVFNNGSNFTIDGANTLEVNAGGIDVQDAFDYTINAPLQTQTQTWNVVSGGSVSFAMTNDNGGQSFTKTGGGSVTLDDNATGSHDITIQDGLLTLNAADAASNSYVVGDESTADSATITFGEDAGGSVAVRRTGTLNVGANTITPSSTTMSGGTINIDAGGEWRANGGNVGITYTSTANGGQAIIEGDGVVNMRAGGSSRFFDIEDNASVAQDMIVRSKVTMSENNLDLDKKGTGTLVFEGANDYTKGTNVNAGTLLINGTTTGQGTYTVASGATLGGTGTIDALVTTNAGGIVAPGASVGTLNVSNNDVSLVDAILAIELDAGISDLLSVDNGALDLSGADIDVTHLATPTESEYLIASATEGITLSSTTVSGDGAWTLDLRSGGDELFLIPEPATLALLGLGGAVMLTGRKRRNA